MSAGVGARVASAFYGKRLDFTERRRRGLVKGKGPNQGWEGMPEVRVVADLREAGWTPGHVRLFLTFVASMDRARDADRLWDQAKTAALGRDSSWVFDPAAVVGRSLRDLQAVLRRSGVSQRHLGDGAAWRTIAESLLDGDRCAVVRRAVHDGEGAVDELLGTGGLDAEFDGAPCFPYLSGPKVGPMWLRMLVEPGGAEIRGLESLDVAVDVQVRKVTENLGVTTTVGRELEEVREEIENAWRADVLETAIGGPERLGGGCAALDPALWYFGKWGCTHCEKVGDRMPFAEGVCDGCRWEPGSRIVYGGQ